MVLQIKCKANGRCQNGTLVTSARRNYKLARKDIDFCILLIFCMVHVFLPSLICTFPLSFSVRPLHLCLFYTCLFFEYHFHHISIKKIKKNLTDHWI